MLAEILGNPIFFYTIVLLTSILSASTGVGGSFILIPLAAMQFGVKESVGILSVYFLFQNINKITVFRKFINWKVSTKVILWSLPGVVIGSLALNIIPVDVFKKVIGIAILFYLANDVFKILPSKHQPDAYVPGLSLLYGFLSGLIGSGNIIKGPLFSSLGLLKETYIGTYALTALFVNVPKIISYSATGIIDGKMFMQSIPFLIISIAGTYIGKHFLGKIRTDVFYYILNGSFALSAIVLLAQ